MMSRLEEAKRAIRNNYPDERYSMRRDALDYVVSESERVQGLESRNAELEYASQYNGKLNEFLQKRNLPPKTLGKHVVAVAMQYIEELEFGLKTAKRNDDSTDGEKIGGILK